MPALELEKGVVYYEQIFQEDKSFQRLQISSGTQTAAQFLHEGNYCANGFVPQHPWNNPNSEQLMPLTGNPLGLEIGMWLSVVQVPDEILKPFSELKQASSETHDLKVLQELARAPHIRPGIDAFMEYAKMYSMSTEQPIEGGGISLHPAGLETLAYDYKNNCFVGLHLDSWYKHALLNRPQSPNRICVNLGSELRYLLFINLPIPRILELVQDAAPENTEGRRIHVEFMNLYPNYPVVKLAIRPGEAYIAPTENIIHDGSSAGKEHLDVSLTFRGQFGFAGTIP